MYNQTDPHVKEQKAIYFFCFIFFLDNRPLMCFYASTLRGIINAWAEENGKHKAFQLRVLVLLLLCTGLPAA
jgi:hypothetical protein